MIVTSIKVQLSVAQKSVAQMIGGGEGIVQDLRIANSIS